MKSMALQDCILMIVDPNDSAHDFAFARNLSVVVYRSHPLVPNSYGLRWGMTQFAPTTSPHTYPHMSAGPPLPFLFNIFSESLGSPMAEFAWRCVGVGLWGWVGGTAPPPDLDCGWGEELVCKFPPTPTTILISAFELRLARSC